jgi:hypothetical protein
VIRARNAGAVIGNYRAAGARCVIVNGVVDPDLGVRPDLLGQAAVTACRLRADPEEVVRRLRGRDGHGDGDPGDTARLARGDCERMDASGLAGVCVDTTGVPAAEVARLVRDGCRDWHGFGAAARERPDTLPPGPASLAAIWRTYHAAGARQLVLAGPVENQAALQAHLAALPAAAVTVCRLHAGPAELRRRIITRGEGGSWPQPGDPLLGRSASYLSRVASRSAADAQALDRASLDAIRIDTDGHTAAQAAGLIAATARWPGR